MPLQSGLRRNDDKLFGGKSYGAIQPDYAAVQIAVAEDERHGLREFFRLAEP